MSKFDAYEKEILSAYKRGDIKPLSKKQADLGKYRSGCIGDFFER